MSRDHFRLTEISALDSFRLRLNYVDGSAWEVDLTERIETSPLLAPLKDPALFAQAHIGLGGWSVDWIEDELDLASDNLRNLAVEQAGGIGHERIWHWLARTKQDLAQGAKTLGITPRMLARYRDGKSAIPRYIWLACLGWEAVRPQGRGLPMRIPSAREYAAVHA